MPLEHMKLKFNRMIAVLKQPMRYLNNIGKAFETEKSLDLEIKMYEP